MAGLQSEPLPKDLATSEEWWAPPFLRLARIADELAAVTRGTPSGQHHGAVGQKKPRLDNIFCPRGVAQVLRESFSALLAVSLCSQRWRCQA